MYNKHEYFNFFFFLLKIQNFVSENHNVFVLLIKLNNICEKNIKFKNVIKKLQLKIKKY